jgi:hypothetical protein
LIKKTLASLPADDLAKDIVRKNVSAFCKRFIELYNDYKGADKVSKTDAWIKKQFEEQDYNTTIWKANRELETFQTKELIFTNNYSDVGIDIDADGKYDFLRVYVSVDVSVAGEYTISGSLSGIYYGNAYTTVHLNAGEQNVSLDFVGSYIYANGKYGPYALCRLFAFTGKGEKGSRIVDMRLDAADVGYSTDAYKYYDFAAPAARINKITSNFLMDTNDNELFDYLVVRLNLDVVTAGEYTVTAILLNCTGTFITAALNCTYLTSGSQYIDLYFDGKVVGKNTIGLNKFVVNLTDLLIFDDNCTLVGWYPKPYTYTKYEKRYSFERPEPQFTLDYKDYSIDTDNDGVLDFLAIETNIIVDRFGIYRITGCIFDEDGKFVAYATSTTPIEEYGVRTVQLEFPGYYIHSAKSNGTFNLCIRVYENNRFVAALDDAYTTSSYSYTDFNATFPADEKPSEKPEGFDSLLYILLLITGILIASVVAAVMIVRRKRRS